MHIFSALVLRFPKWNVRFLLGKNSTIKWKFNKKAILAEGLTLEAD
jgi:hypothetical protein